MAITEAATPYSDGRIHQPWGYSGVAKNKTFHNIGMKRPRTEYCHALYGASFIVIIAKFSTRGSVQH